MTEINLKLHSTVNGVITFRRRDKITPNRIHVLELQNKLPFILCWY